MREVCSWFDLLQHLQFCKGFRQLLSEKGEKKGFALQRSSSKGMLC